MPRIRTIKPGHWTDKGLAEISLQAHLLWIATWNFSDDEGIFEADPLLLRSNIFPRRTDIRIDQVAQWLDQLVKARFIIPFQYEGEGYYITRTFKTHQKIDRPQKSKIPSDVIRRVFDEWSTNVRPCIVEDSIVEEKEDVGETAEAVSEAVASPTSPQDLYNSLEKNKVSISAFIKEHRPDWAEPYVDLWNFFAVEKKLSRVTKISRSRRKKFQVRIADQGFDFIEILKKAAQSEFLLTGRWFCFDWILENESNYLKVVEGNYDLKNEVPKITKPREVYQPPPRPPKPVEPQLSEEQKLEQSRQFVEDLYQDYLEGTLRAEMSMGSSAYDFIKKQGLMKLGPGAAERITEKAKTKRLAELKNSEYPDDHKLFKEFTEAPDQIKTDAPYNRHAKVLALLEYFEMAKIQERKKIFQ